MNSIRERILRTLHERLTAALAPVPVLRQPTTPLSRDTGPALLLIVEGESVSERSNRLADRVLTVRLVAVARGAQALNAADLLMVASHQALLADPGLGGLALGLRDLDCEWESDDADTGAAAIPARYEVRYRTLVHDLRLIH